MLNTVKLMVLSIFFITGNWALAAEVTSVGTTKSASNDGVAKQEDVLVEMKTNLGSMVIKLYPEQAPATVKNFLDYVDRGFYDGVIFHRVVPNFVVQAGGFDKQFQRKATARSIINESNNGLKNLRGTLSMARTNAPNSATSQFFINLVDNASLDYRPGSPGYAVFGEVIKGIQAIDSMALLEQGKHRGQFQNAPNETVMIESAQRMSVQAKPTKK